MGTSTNIFGRLEVNSKPSDYAISGVIGSGIIDGSLNYQKYKDGKISKEEAIKSTVKTSAQVAIAAGTSIASVQYLSDKKYLNALLSVAIGVSGVMAVEKVCKAKENKKEEKEENGN